VPPTNDPHEKELLAVKYKVFLEQCNSQQVYRREVDDVVNKWGKVGSADKEKEEGGKGGGGVNLKLPLV